MVDFLGRLIYSALDWGLGNDVERELSDTLELLIYQMTKLDTHHMKAGEHFQPVCTFEEVLQVTFSVGLGFAESQYWKLMPGTSLTHGYVSSLSMLIVGCVTCRELGKKL